MFVAVVVVVVNSSLMMDACDSYLFAFKELQEDAEKAAKEADKHAQEKAQQEVELNAPGSRRLLFNGTSIPGESTSMRTESELEPLSSKPPQHPASSQAKQSSQNLRNSDPNITHNVDDKSDVRMNRFSQKTSSLSELKPHFPCSCRPGVLVSVSFSLTRDDRKTTHENKTERIKEKPFQCFCV